MIKILTIYLLSFVFSSLYAKVSIELSHKKVLNGTTFAVILQSDKKLNKAPNAIFKNKTYQMFTILGNTKKYEVFIPVDYKSSIKKETISVVYVSNNKIIKKHIIIDIIDGNYKKNEIINVPKNKVVLSKKNKKKSNNEYAKVYKNVYSKINSINYVNQSLFVTPIKSQITSTFGNARVYNNKVRSYHSGTDFRAKIGTPIFSANNGKVVLVMNRFYLGNVVYIDHGRGAYTYYCHMDKIDVKIGDMVKKGQHIGLSGDTGRTTGPHLHFALRLYNVTVDPLQFSALHNKIIKEYH